jgi:hypothetical protein
VHAACNEVQVSCWNALVAVLGVLIRPTTANPLSCCVQSCPRFFGYPCGRICGRLAPSELREGSVPSATVFSPNTFRLQSALHGSKRKVEVASARRKLPDDNSTLPRLLTSVYTPLLRCATVSDACNLACGLRTKQTGAALRFPVCISGQPFVLPFATFRAGWSVTRIYAVAAFAIRLVFAYFSNNSCSACCQSSLSYP